MAIEDKILRELGELQNKINCIASLLPENAQIEFHCMDFTRPTDYATRLRLVIRVKELPIQ
ncbi:MAG: hypothetical protein M3N23_12215 [Pseudomonadota bacterium]|nr:hypothetical protein [Pseudomonadota bacterium]